MSEDKKDNQSSPSWEIFWQEHGQSILKQEEEERLKTALKSENKKAVNQTAAPETAVDLTIKGRDRTIKDKESVYQEGEKSSLKHKTLITLIICILLFILVSGGTGYYVLEKLKADKAEINALIEERTAAMEDQNDQAFSAINDRLIGLESQMDDLLSILEDTDDAIVQAGADSREAMSEKIAELDEQLAQLKASLEILMEDQNAR